MRRCKDKDIGKRFETADLEKPSRSEGRKYDEKDPDMDMTDPDLVRVGSDEWLAEELMNIANMLMEDDDE